MNNENETKCILLKRVTGVHISVEVPKSGKGYKLVLHATFESGKEWNKTLLWSPISIDLSDRTGGDLLDL